jgi:3-oxoacyl-[acyl-carrier protein] reductase
MTTPSVRTALVTGAAGGIGRELVTALLGAGHRVLALDTDESALTTLTDLPGDASRLAVCAGDVADEAAWDRAVAEAERSLGPVDVLVNNAGISPKRDGVKPALDEIDPAEWRQVLEVNLTSAFLGARAVVPGMKERGWGRIVNMSSQAGRTAAVIAGIHYGASKAGMLGLTRALAGELGPFGITVNAVAPGRIESPMMRAGSEEVNRAALQRIPVRRFGQPADIAAAVLYLVGNEAGFITGATIDANGGSFMA